jgi:hypothetical protein
MIFLEASFPVVKKVFLLRSISIVRDFDSGRPKREIPIL